MYSNNILNRSLADRISKCTDYIIYHLVLKKEKDKNKLQEKLDQKIQDCKDVAYTLRFKGKGKVFDPQWFRSVSWIVLYDGQILSALCEVGIIEKISNREYRILVDDKDVIDIKFSECKFIVDEPYAYKQIIEHSMLAKKEKVNANSEIELQNKVNLVIKKWDDEWKVVEPDYERKKWSNILKESINSNFSLESFIIKQDFIIDKPQAPELIDFSVPEPSYPKKHFLFGVSKEDKKLYDIKKKDWESKRNENKNENSDKLKEYENKLSLWKIKLDEFYSQQAERNQSTSDIFYSYEEGKDSESVSNYFKIILDAAFSKPFIKERLINFDTKSRIITVNAEIPLVDDVYDVKERKYIESNWTFKEKKYSLKELRQIYDSAIYQYILSLMHLIVKHDYQECVDEVSVNCWVNYLDKSLGVHKVKFIASVVIMAKDFNETNLELVDPKECFRRFKSISGNKLYEVCPIKPVHNLQTNDSRFIEAINVIHKLNEDTNLASMDWEEFEYLVRELFEKEYAPNGAKVKVTQSSKDGGVDVVVLDPDPIKGGKIIIQAKRYTNVVGVSAVRDLAGTIAHEGANKGIIVTTSHYGNDSYDFAKGKPITLINGSELLYLLERHGYKARIDVNDAKTDLKRKRSLSQRDS